VYAEVIKENLTVNQFVNRVAQQYFGFNYLILDDIVDNLKEAKNPAKIKELERIVEMIHGKDYKPEDIMKKLLPHQVNMKCLKSCNLKKTEPVLKPSMVFKSVDRENGFIMAEQDMQKSSGVEPYDVPLPKRKSFNKRVSTEARGKLSVDEVRAINVKKNNENMRKLIDEHVYKAKILHRKEHALYSSKPEPS